eukprot:365987-Chlamydomonas_euryale.AAC.33
MLTLVVMDSLLRVFFNGRSLMTNAGNGFLGSRLVRNVEEVLLQKPLRKGTVVHSGIAKLYSIITDMHESEVKHPDLDDDEVVIDGGTVEDKDGGFFPPQEIIVYEEMSSEGYFEKLLTRCFDKADLIEFRHVKGAVSSALA